MVENPIVGPKFRPFSTDVTIFLSKLGCTATALQLNRLSECIIFQTF
jgi:hypothetical protein